MNLRPDRRRSSQFFPWLAAGIAVTALSSCLALAAWTYLQEGEMRSLRAGVEAQLQARSRSEAEVVALQGTATALEGRLAALESDAQSQGPAGSGHAEGSDASPQGIEELGASVADLRAELEDLRSALNVVVDRMHSQAPAVGSLVADEPPPSLPVTARLSIARQRQSHNLSCESSAASMAAQYHGVPLSEEQVLALLPYNSNPHLGFRGNVDGPTGDIVDYGVYAGPIADILNAHGLHARIVSGGLEEIKSAITAGNPVIAWVTYDCMASTPTTILVDGQNVTLVPNQHAVVVTGFSADGVWANDPWDGQEDFYPTSDFLRAMSYFGNMAIVVAQP